jgi:hypothetical protein
MSCCAAHDGGKGGGAGGRQRLGEAAGGADVVRRERIGEQGGSKAGACAGTGGEDEGPGTGAAVAQARPAPRRVGGERDLARVAPPRLAVGRGWGAPRRDVSEACAGGARGTEPEEAKEELRVGCLEECRSGYTGEKDG